MKRLARSRRQAEGAGVSERVAFANADRRRRSEFELGKTVASLRSALRLPCSNPFVDRSTATHLLGDKTPRKKSLSSGRGGI